MGSPPQLGTGGFGEKFCLAGTPGDLHPVLRVHFKSQNVPTMLPGTTVLPFPPSFPDIVHGTSFPRTLSALCLLLTYKVAYEGNS